MIIGLLAWAVSGLFVFLLSYSLHRLLRTGRPSLEVISFSFLLIFTATLLILVAGLVGWLRPVPILLLSIAGIAGIFTIGSFRVGVPLIVGESRSLVRAAIRWWASLPSWLRMITVIAVLLSTARFLFLVWALPPFVWDSLSYHLTNIAHWIQAGRIETFDTPVDRIFNPANYEVFATWFAVFVHHDAVIEAAGIPPYVLAVVAVYAAARGIGRSRSASVLAALAYGSTPAVIIAATGTKNDIFLAAYYLTALALVIDLTFRPAERTAPASLGRLMLLALVLLMAAGTKTYILHLLPGLLLMPILWTRGRGGRLRISQLLVSGRQEFRLLARPGRILLIGVLVSGLFMGIFWNVRNWVVSGNPFYPYDVLVAGKTVFQGPESEFRLSTRELAANLQGFAAKFGDWQDPIRPDLPNTTGWGWFAYVIGLPSLGWAVLRRRRARPLVLGFALSFLLLMLSTGPSPWNMRFAIWFPAVFSLCFSELVDSLPASLPRISRKAFVAYLTLMLGVNFVATLNYNRVSAEEFRSMLALPVGERHSAVFRDNMPDPYTLALEVVPNDEVLGFNVTGNGFIYPLYRADLSQEIAYVRFAAFDNCEQVAAAMLASGTRYLLVAPEHTEDEKISVMRACAETGEVIRERARGVYVIRR